MKFLKKSTVVAGLLAIAAGLVATSSGNATASPTGSAATISTGSISATPFGSAAPKDDTTPATTVFYGKIPALPATLPLLGQNLIQPFDVYDTPADTGKKIGTGYLVSTILTDPTTMAKPNVLTMTNVILTSGAKTGQVFLRSLNQLGAAAYDFSVVSGTGDFAGANSDGKLSTPTTTASSAKPRLLNFTFNMFTLNF